MPPAKKSKEARRYKKIRKPLSGSESDGSVQFEKPLTPSRVTAASKSKAISFNTTSAKKVAAVSPRKSNK